MMESAFDVIFKLADGPIKHIENIIKKLAVKTGVKLGGLFKIPTASQSQVHSVEPMDFESKFIQIFFTNFFHRFIQMLEMRIVKVNSLNHNIIIIIIRKRIPIQR